MSVDADTGAKLFEGRCAAGWRGVNRIAETFIVIVRARRTAAHASIYAHIMEGIGEIRWSAASSLVEICDEANVPVVLALPQRVSLALANTRPGYFTLVEQYSPLPPLKQSTRLVRPRSSSH